MTVFLRLISAAFYVMLFQNLIFNGGYGISEAVRMSAKPRQLVPMTIFITYFSTLVSVICVLLDTIPVINGLSEIMHAIIFIAVVGVLYLITVSLVLLSGKASPRTVRRIGVAAFNTLVFAVPLINYRSAFSVAEAIGSGVGAGIAFVIAVILINSGLKRLEMNKSIPQSFKGTPAMFIYVALLSLAFIGISGNSVFI
ncbi:MAG: hypothetical protein IKB36_00350 [Clostridia bacterium]|nr:hypothetical protein [Clostridia bacterium]